MKRVAFLALLMLALRTASASMWYVDGSVSASGDGKSWETAFQAIQEGIDAASSGDTVTVAKGLYVENIHFNGKNIVLTSTDPLDSDVVASTIIDGNQAGSVVTFSGAETAACVLSGLKIRNGRAAEGGGILGNVFKDGRNRATIRNNIISGNMARDRGGGIHGCDGMIENNAIANNSSDDYGGGISWCDGVIRKNVIRDNSARWRGGGLERCDAEIEDNLISANSAESNGGGLSECNGLIARNLITGNSARQGGGLDQCRGTVSDNGIIDNRADYAGGICGGYGGIIRNNLIAGNVAGTGGGIGYPAATIVNNTIVRNISLSVGGGVRGTSVDPTIYNCIIWGNEAPSEPQFSLSPPGRGEVTHCCIQDWTGGGEGNIADDPRFLDLGGGDYRLLPFSPCIDAGFNDPQLAATDISGMHRIMYGGKSLTVDMGAYESHIWPPSFDSPMGEVTLKWSSLTEKTYSVYRSKDMLTWELAVDGLPSMGDTFTTWLDPTVVPPSPEVRIRFYRIVEEE